MICSDSQAALSICSNGKPSSARSQLRQPNQTLVQAIHIILSKRSGPTEFLWVRGYNGDAMNELADLAANQARESSPPLLSPLVITVVNQFQFRLAGTGYHGYGRWIIKKLAITAHTNLSLRCSKGGALQSLSNLN